MAETKLCKHCEQVFITTAEKRNYCGSVCIAERAVSLARERNHKFYEAMSYYEKIIYEELVAEEYCDES